MVADAVANGLAKNWVQWRGSNVIPVTVDVVESDWMVCIEFDLAGEKLPATGENVVSPDTSQMILQVKQRI